MNEDNRRTRPLVRLLDSKIHFTTENTEKDKQGLISLGKSILSLSVSIILVFLIFSVFSVLSVVKCLLWSS